LRSKTVLIGCKRVRVVIGETLRIDGLVLEPATLLMLGHDLRHHLMIFRSTGRTRIVRWILRNPGSLLQVVVVGAVDVYIANL